MTLFLQCTLKRTIFSMYGGLWGPCNHGEEQGEKPTTQASLVCPDCGVVISPCFLHCCQVSQLLRPFFCHRQSSHWPQQPFGLEIFSPRAEGNSHIIVF